jgi:hypothetical protein
VLTSADYIFAYFALYFHHSTNDSEMSSIVIFIGKSLIAANQALDRHILANKGMFYCFLVSVGTICIILAFKSKLIQYITLDF